MRRLPLLLFLVQLTQLHHAKAQLHISSSAQVKITDMPFAVANAQHVNQLTWTMLGTTAKETYYCVSESPVSQLRFVCVDCLERNITDMVGVLNGAQDLTRSAGFPTVVLKNVAALANWTGVTIMCQAALHGGTVDSAPALVEVRYMNKPHVVDAQGHAPVMIPNQGNRFYVECTRGADGQCQSSGRRKTLRCDVQAQPPPTLYRWLKNGVVTSSGHGAEISIGPEMIGQSIQCAANNALFADDEMPSSQAVQIDPYTSARIVKDNFAQLQNSAPFQSNGRLEMGQQISLGCQVEGNPRPVVFWRMRRANGQVVDAACPQGFDGQYQEVSTSSDASVSPYAQSIVRLNALCVLRVSNYSYTGQYWCSACSYVSQGAPECAPETDAPGPSTLTVQVQGPPMAADQPPTIEQMQTNQGLVAIVTVHYCADPMPRPPREVIFSIDQNDLQIGQSWRNFQFEGPTQQNNTEPSCYMARLRISPVSDDDQSRTILLKLQNSFGSRQIPVSLDALLGGSAMLGARVSIGWIVFCCLLAAALLFACCLAYCIRQHVFCFQRMKDTPSEYSDSAAKTTNGKAIVGGISSGGGASSHTSSLEGGLYQDHFGDTQPRMFASNSILHQPQLMQHHLHNGEDDGGPNSAGQNVDDDLEIDEEDGRRIRNSRQQADESPNPSAAAHYGVYMSREAVV